MAATLVYAVPAVADIALADQWPGGDAVTGEWEQMPVATVRGTATLESSTSLSAAGTHITLAAAAL